MHSVRVTLPKMAGILLIGLVALAGCNNGGGSSSSSAVTAPTALSYPIPAPLIRGLPIAPLLPALAGGAPTSFTVTPALPAGLALDAGTGEISGTPTLVTPLASYLVRASNSAGFVEFVLELVVDPQAPCGLTYTVTDATYTVGQPITRNLPSLGCDPADSFDVTPPLPAGLLLDTLTGEITGTPTASAATAVHTVTASNVTGSDSIDLTITVLIAAPCGLAYDDPAPVYTVGTPIPPNTVTSACGPGTSWTISPALPGGLALDPATGTIAGNPTQVLAATLFTVTGSNSAGSDTVGITITVNAAAPCNLTYSQPTATYQVGQPIPPNLATVGCGPATAFTVSPALPAGLTLNAVTGTISGTPTTITPAAAYLVTASNVSGSTSTTLALAVAPQAPCQLGYALRNAVYLQGIPIAPNAPSFGCGTPTSWTVSPALPAGLQLNAITGVISGTPSVLSSITSYLVTASNASGSAQVSITITINPQAPCNLTYSSPSATYIAGTPIAPNTPSFGCGPVTLFTIAPALPAGLSISPATGVISGTPNAASPATSYTITASNVTGSDTASVTIAVIPQAPCNLVYSQPVATYQQGLPISPNTATTGCGIPTSFTVAPALPAGLALNPTTGTITGTPTTLGGPTSHTVTAQNATGSTTATITITIVPQAPCTIAYANPAPVYLVGAPITPNTATFGCGTPTSWTISPALPAGLAINAASGTISGTPTQVIPPTVFTVTASNATGSANASLTIRVNPLAPCNLTYTNLSPTYLVGLPIPTNAASSGCGAPTSWTVAPALPAGLNLNPTTGAITGTPQVAAGSGAYTVTGSNVTGSDTVVLTITVNPQAPCNVAYLNPAPTYLVGTPIPPNTATFGCGTPTSWTVSPALPPGLSLDPVSGTITGVPTATAPATAHTVTAANVTGSANATVTITVNPQAPCGLTYSAPTATYTVGVAITPNLPSVACGAPSSWTIAPALPAGLALNATTGAISGTPTAATPATAYTVTASNATGSDTAVLTLTVNPAAPCNLAYSSPTSIYLVGLAIAPNVPSFGCGTPTSFSIAPALPAGLTLHPVTGVISGTPTTVSLFTSYTVTASNVTGSDTETISITVNPQAPCNLSYSTPSASYLVGTPIAANVPDVQCGAPVLWQISPALPSGLLISPLTGVITGTPTAVSPSTSYTVTASNVTGADTVSITIQVLPQAPCNLTYSNLNPNYVPGEPITPNVPSFGCGAPDTWTIAPPLPAGLVLNSSTGVITGTPAAQTPTVAHVVTASNATGSATVTLNITVDPQAPCNLAYSAPSPTYLQGLPITPNLPSWSCGDPTSFAIAPALPIGLALNPTTGAITGTPAVVTATAVYTVTASNITGSDSTQLTITIAPQAPCNLIYDDESPTYLLGLPIPPNNPGFGCGVPAGFTVAPPLPAGLSLHPVTGVISGTPTALVTASVHNVTASNVTGSDTVTLTITVAPQAPCNLAYSSPTSIYLAGLPIAPNVATTSCGTPTSFTIAPALPAGLTLHPTTGLISGTPTALIAATAFTVTASNVTGSDTEVITITVNPQAPCGLAYSEPVATYLIGLLITPNVPSFSCGTPTSFTISPALPAGLVIHPTAGIISGTPTALSPQTTYTVTASNITGSDTALLSIAVQPQAPCNLAYAQPTATYQLGLPIFPNVPTTSCGTPTGYTISPALPAGLSLHPTTGVISGTPAALSPPTTYTVTASNASGSDTATVQIEVVPQAPCDIAYPLPSALYLQGIPIAPNVPTTGCGAPATWSISPALPAGLLFSTVSGTISGTPTALSPATTYTVTATNVTGSETVQITITVNPQAPCTIAYPIPTAVYLLGDPITPNVPTFGCGTPTTWSISPALPAGLLFSTATGTISGAPTVLSAPTSYTVTASNVTGSATTSISIAVDPQAPATVTYSQPSATYPLGLPITPNVPTTTGGTPNAWTISPALPAGLVLSAASGVISGTPTATSPATSYLVTASNVSGSANATVVIAVIPQAPCNVAYPTPAALYLLGDPIAPNVPTFECGTPDSWSIAPALPAGLLFSTATGTISGTPTALSPLTTYSVTASNSTGSDTVSITITVNPQAPANLAYADPAPTYLQGIAITPNTPSFTGGAPTLFTVAPALPAGLSLHPTTGVISGTPTALASATAHTITASNVTGSDSATVTITVNPQAPADLAYADPSPTYLEGSPIAPNTPSFTGGAPTLFTVAPALPAGLSLHPTTGVISGTPTALASATAHTITASNVTGSDTATVTITVNPQAPCNVAYPTPAATYLEGIAIAPNVPTFGCGTPTSWSISPALPAGLLFSAANGAISGTPTALSPPTTYTVTASNVTGSDTVSITIAVDPQAPCNVAYPVPAAVYLQGDPITPNVPTFGCGTPDNWAIAPALPAGLLFSAATGTISGTPTALSTITTFVVTASNVTGSDTVSITIAVNPQAPADLAYADPAPTYLEGIAITPNTPSFTGGAPTLYQVAPALPAGLSLHPTTGVISGTPTALVTASAHTITASNVTGSDTATVTITVDPQAPCNVAYPTPAAIYLQGIAIVPNVPTFGCGTPTSWSIAPALPAGLLFSAANGAISGTPTVLSPATTYTVTASNITGSDTASVTITVNPQAPANLTYATPSALYLVGVAIAPNVPTTTGGTPDTWAIAPALPAGLALSPTTGVISGTPTAVSPETSYLVTASNVTGSTTATITIEVENPAPCTIVYPLNPASYLVGQPITPQTPTVGCGAPTGFAIAPALPAGLLLHPATGTLSGTPTAASPLTAYTVTASNAFGSDTVILSIQTVLQAPCSLDYGTTFLSLIQNQPLAPLTPTVGCGAPTNFSVAPPLPAGLVLSASNGTLSGTPTALTPAAAFTVTASNAAGSTTAVLTIEVLTAGPCDLTYSDPEPTYPPGAAIPPNVPSVGCGGATGYSIAPALPAGLAFSTTTGIISGTPTTVTLPTTFTITATNPFGSTSTTMVLRVDRVFIFSSADQSVPYSPTDGLGDFTQHFFMLESSANASFPTPTLGISMAIAHDPTMLTAMTVVEGADIAALNGGNGADYWFPFFNGEGVTIGALFSFTFLSTLVADVPREIAVIDYDTVPGALAGDLDGATTVLLWANTAGTPPVDNLVVLDGSTGITPVFVEPTITLVPTP